MEHRKITKQFSPLSLVTWGELFVVKVSQHSESEEEFTESFLPSLLYNDTNGLKHTRWCFHKISLPSGFFVLLTTHSNLWQAFLVCGHDALITNFMQNRSRLLQVAKLHRQDVRIPFRMIPDREYKAGDNKGHKTLPILCCPSHDSVNNRITHCPMMLSLKSRRYSYCLLSYSSSLFFTDTGKR